METPITVWILLSIWSTPVSPSVSRTTASTLVFETEAKCEEEKLNFLRRKANRKLPEWAALEDYEHMASCNWVEIIPSAFAKTK